MLCGILWAVIATIDIRYIRKCDGRSIAIHSPQRGDTTPIVFKVGETAANLRSSLKGQVPAFLSQHWSRLVLLRFSKFGERSSMSDLLRAFV